MFAFLTVLSLTAGLTGADPDGRWGLLRRAVFLVGITGLLGTACLRLIRVLDRRLMARGQLPGETERELGVAPRSHRPEAVSADPMIPSPAGPHRRWIGLTAGAGTVAVIVITYVGLVSVWHWTWWPPTTTYYGMLGEAVTQGKTYLPIEPAPGLADLQNPYARGAWAQGNGLANHSYYQGKYYLYWGPAPAVALAVVRMLGAPTPGDQVVVFAAISLMFLFSSLVVIHLRRLYFRGVPLWLTIAGLLIVATVHPMLWFQNSPSILTAAIAGGQVFLLGGVYFMVRALTNRQAGAWKYAAAGTLWGLAVASRVTSVASVTVLVLGVAMVAFRRSGPVRGRRTVAVNLASLLTSLGLVLGLYGWYNQIRFGSPIEFGARYAFTEFDIGAELERGTVFNLRYLVPNTLYYLLAPVRLISRFPFLRPVYYEYPLFTQLLTKVGVPAEHRVEDATRLVFAAPALLFALTFARKWFYGGVPSVSREDLPIRDHLSCFCSWRGSQARCRSSCSSTPQPDTKWTSSPCWRSLRSWGCGDSTRTPDRTRSRADWPQLQSLWWSPRERW